MIKTTCLAMVACLSMAATAYAAPDETIDATPSADRGSSMALQDGVLDETHLYDASFSRPEDDTESLDVEMRVDPCSGEGCRKEFQFQLQCETASGYTQEIDSPWYRNYSTDGFTTKTYAWQDSRLTECDYIGTIGVAFRDGWSDDSADSP